MEKEVIEGNHICRQLGKDNPTNMVIWVLMYKVTPFEIRYLIQFSIRNRLDFA